MPASNIGANDDIDARFVAATAIIREAGALALSYFRSRGDLGIREKSRRDIVTSADLAVDRLIRDQLAAAFPRDGILTEESGGALAPDLWVIDPIDGTANFVRGIAHFAISIAFQHDGRTEIGLVLDPVGGELYSARRGRGASANGQVLRASGSTDPSNALVDTGYSERRPVSEYHALVGRLLAAGYGYCMHGSAALGLAFVAGSRFDAFCENDLFAWDVLAGLLIVREAGGWVSNFSVDPDGPRGRPVLACAAGLASSLRHVTGFRL